MDNASSSGQTSSSSPPPRSSMIPPASPSIPKLAIDADSLIAELEALAATEGGSRTRRVMDYFQSRQSSFPGKESIEGTGLKEYLEACEKYKTVPSSSFIQCLVSKNPVQHRWIGSHVGLLDAGITSISCAIAINQTIKILQLIHCGFTSAPNLFSAIANNKTLEELDISENNLGYQSGPCIAEALKFHPTIKTLSLRKCNLQDVGIKSICDALQDNMIIYKIDLSENRCGLIGGRAIADMMSGNASLREISIRYNQLQPDAGELIGKALDENHALTRLDLSWNSIGTEGGKHIGRALDRGCCLRFLDISNCSISAEAANTIAQGIESTSYLETIMMQNNPKIGEEAGRKLLRALSINTSVKTFSMRGSISASVSGKDEGSHVFSETNPNGHYRLKLSDAYDRTIAKKLYDLQLNHDVGDNWLHCRFNGTKIPAHDISAAKWKIPDDPSGILEFDYRSNKKPPANAQPVEDADLHMFLLRELSHPALVDHDRLALVRFASTVCYYTCAQCVQIFKALRVHSTPTAGGIYDDKIEAFVALFPRLLDPEKVNSLILIPQLFSKKEILLVQKRLGPLLAFSRENASGHYRLNLQADFDRLFARNMYQLSFAEPQRRLKTRDAVVFSSTFGVRNSTLDGRPFSLEAKKKAKEEEAKRVRAERREKLAKEKAAREKLKKKKVDEDGGDDEKEEVAAEPEEEEEEEEEEVTQSLDEELEELLPKSGVLELDYVHGVPVEEKDSKRTKQCTSVHMELLKSIAENPQLSPKESSILMRLEINQLSFTGEDAAKVVAFVQHPHWRLYIAVALYARVLDRKRQIHHIVKQFASDQESMLQFCHRIGNINVWDRTHPDRYYKLDLANTDDRYVSKQLLILSLGDDGTNWQNERLNGEPFRFSENNNTYKLPHEGIFELEYVTGLKSKVLGMQEGIALGGASSGGNTFLTLSEPAAVVP